MKTVRVLWREVRMLSNKSSTCIIGSLLAFAQRSSEMKITVQLTVLLKSDQRP